MALTAKACSKAANPILGALFKPSMPPIMDDLLGLNQSNTKSTIQSLLTGGELPLPLIAVSSSTPLSSSTVMIASGYVSTLTLDSVPSSLLPGGPGARSQNVTHDRVHQTQPQPPQYSYYTAAYKQQQLDQSTKATTGKCDSS